MKINVTPLDLEKGKRNDPYGCPLALALCRAFGVGAVVASYVRLTVGGKDFFPSLEMKQFMEAYDRGYQLEPMEFELEDAWVPCGVITLSN